MKNPTPLIWLILSISCLTLTTFYASPSFAQSANLSFTFVVNDDAAVDGDILASTENGLARATTSSGNQLFGVLQLNPLILLSTSSDNTKPVATSGTPIVNVTTLGGPIKQGDYISPSTIAGKGQKSVGDGYVLGVAQADFDGSGADTTTVDGQQIAAGQIPVAIKIDYSGSSDVGQGVNGVLTSLSSAFLNNLQDPEGFFEGMRYLIAGLIMFVSFVFGFFTFSRSIPKAVEAIGRNPLAKNSIYFSIMMNIVFTTVTIGVGLIAAVVIIIF